MPFCTHCGVQTSASDRFCAHCGTGQDAPAAPPPGAAPAPDAPPLGSDASRPESEAPPGPPASPRLRPHIAALLCYLPSVGWIASVFFLTADQYRRNRYVHFHALQGLFLFVAYLLVRTVFSFSPHVMMDAFSVNVFPTNWGLNSVLKLAVVVIQVVGMVQTAKGMSFHIPVIGDIAERSMT